MSHRPSTDFQYLEVSAGYPERGSSYLVHEYLTSGASMALKTVDFVTKFKVTRVFELFYLIILGGFYTRYLAKE